MKLNPILAVGACLAAMGTSSLLAQGPDFLSPQTHATGPAPRGIALGDFGGDGRVDVFVANEGDGTVRVYQNGSQTTVPLIYFQADYASGEFGACDVVTADFDQDGWLDFAVANGQSDSVSVFFGDGTAVGFVFGATYPVGIKPAALDAGDLDGDGYPEIVVAEAGTALQRGGVTLLYNDGLGAFGSSLLLSDIGGFADVRLADLDGALGLDVVATDSGGLWPATDAAVHVWLNDGLGSFLSSQAWSQDFELGISGWDVFADPVWHADRVPSGTHGVTSLSGSWHAERDTVFHANNGGPATNFGSYSPSFPAGGYMTRQAIYLDEGIFAANIGKHMEWDSAVSTPGGNHRRDFIFYVGVNAAGDKWSARVGNGSPGNHMGVGAVEFNGTGWFVLEHHFQDNGSGVLEVVFSIFDPASNLVAGGAANPDFVLSNPGDVIGTTVGGNRYGWFTQIEFPFLAFDDTSITRWDAYGNATTLGVTLQGMEIADLDGDGNQDVLVADPGDIYTAGQIHYLPGDGAGGFGPASAYVSGMTGPLALAVADFGEDGDLDLVAADAGGNDITILLDGMGSFGTSWDLASGAIPVALAVTDLDFDNTPDILVINAGSNELKVHPAQPRALVQPYGTGCPGTGGLVPQIAAVGLPTLGNPAFEVEVSVARAYSTAILVFGTEAAEIGVGGLGCQFYVGGHRRQLLAFTDGFGDGSVLAPVPNVGELEGRNFYAQWVVFDPNGNVGSMYSLSDALRVKLGY